ncbi:MAG: hypothetical protein ACO1OB_27275 [Archangium sp.]
MIRVRLSSGVEKWKPSDLVVAVHEGHVDAMTPVSFDEGATWTTASVAALRIGTQKKQPVQPFVYPGWDPRAGFSWWFGLCWFFFAGGPACILAGGYATRSDCPPWLQVVLLLSAFIVGPVTLVFFGLRARRSLQRSKKRGHFGVWVCFAGAMISTVMMLGFRALEFFER